MSEKKNIKVRINSPEQLDDKKDKRSDSVTYNSPLTPSKQPKPMTYAKALKSSRASRRKSGHNKRRARSRSCEPNCRHSRHVHEQLSLLAPLVDHIELAGTRTQPVSPRTPAQRATIKVRLGTFNCENLVARYNFSAAPRRDSVQNDGFTLNELAFAVSDKSKREITAQAIRECDCDILALQEVEEGKVLDRFNMEYLKGMGYDYTLVISAHDPRFIDIGILSRYPIGNIRSHKDERDPSNPQRYLFSRDCLEVEVHVHGAILTLYVNHFKALNKGREQTHDRRVAQAARVAEYIDKRWKSRRYRGNYVVIGDLNDYADKQTSLYPLLRHPGLVNVVERLDKDSQWTHYYGTGNSYQQLDYILLSKSLAKLNTAPPVIMRMGLPYRAKSYEGPRFAMVGWDRPKASDHAPVYIDLLLHVEV